MSEPGEISRRDFLKLGGAAILTALLGKSTLDFVEKAGKGKEETSRDIKESNKPIEGRVNFDEDGVMFLEGKPIVPVELYGLPGDVKKEESWQKAQKLGVNVVTMIPLDDEILSLAEKYNTKIVARLDYLFPEAFEPNPETKALSKEELFKYWESLGYKERVSRLEKSSMLIAWEIDEPDPWKTGQMGPDYFGKIPPMLHAENLLIWLNQNSENKLPVRLTDLGGSLGQERLTMLENFRKAYNENLILGPDVYANPQKILEISGQYNSLRENVKNFSRSNWTVVSAHSDLEGLPDFEKLGSLDEKTISKSLVSSIVGGSRALCFYDNPPGCKNSGCTPDVPVDPNESGYAATFEPLTTVMKTFEPAKEGLLGRTTFKSLNTPLASRTMTHNGKTYVYAVNTSDEGHMTTLVGLDNGNYKELTNGQDVTVNNNNLTLTLPPGGVAVYVSK